MHYYTYKYVNKEYKLFIIHLCMCIDYIVRSCGLVVRTVKSSQMYCWFDAT